MAVMAEKAPQDHRGHPGLLDPLENTVPLEKTVKLAGTRGNKGDPGRPGKQGPRGIKGTLI